MHWVSIRRLVCRRLLNHRISRPGIEGVLRRLTDQPAVVPEALWQTPVLRSTAFSADDFVLPELVSFESLLGLKKRPWSRTWWDALLPTLRSTIGIDPNGKAVTVDLARRPNLAVAGMIGSGKTEALDTFVLGIACHNSPDQVQMITVDGKGSSFNFRRLVELPHIQRSFSMFDDDVTDPDGLRRELLDVLTAELTRRWDLLAVRSQPNWDELWQRDPDGADPYLVVLAEEWSELRVLAPSVTELLVRVARLGRTVGIQVVAGTQRPADLVDFPALTWLALKLWDERDGMWLARVPISLPRVPGRAVLFADGAPTLLQVAKLDDAYVQRLVAAMREAWSA